jgi:AbrB family looped-hinge helix DNA binding protein
MLFIRSLIGNWENLIVLYSDFPIFRLGWDGLESGSWTGRFRVIVRKNGQITLPQEVRQALGIDRGSVLELRVEEGRIVLEVIAR